MTASSMDAAGGTVVFCAGVDAAAAVFCGVLLPRRCGSGVPERGDRPSVFFAADLRIEEGLEARGEGLELRGEAGTAPVGVDDRGDAPPLAAAGLAERLRSEARKTAAEKAELPPAEYLDAEQTELPPPRPWYCYECGEDFQSRADLAVHRRGTHGHRARARSFAQGANCRCCLKFFGTRMRVITHLQYSTSECLEFLVSHVEPLSEAELERLDALDRQEIKTMRAQGHRGTASLTPVGRTAGPLRAGACYVRI